MSTTFLKFLPIQMSDIKDYHDVPMDATPSDNIIGDMTDDQKALWTIQCQYQRRSLEIGVQIQCEGTSPLLQSSWSEADLKMKACSWVLAVSLRDHFNLWDKDYVGIRKGFKVVWVARPPIPFQSFPPEGPQ